MEKELNEEYVEIITEMRELNTRRVEVYKKFKALEPDAEKLLTWMTSPTLYHDLYGVDLDK